MKKILSILIVMSFICSVGFADYYIVDRHGDVIGRTKKAPKQTGLERRGEKAVISSLDLKVKDAAFEDNQIIIKEKSQTEKDLKTYESEFKQEEKAIRNYTKNKNIDEMIASGKIFKYSHKE